MYNDRLQPIRQLGQIRTNNRAIDANTLEMIYRKMKTISVSVSMKFKKKAENNKLIEQYKRHFAR
ncbi:hypothetical protein G3M54_33920 [Bacillus megaterium NBRC 15308 = ATCC 14581]|nr:hypothetical protein [Priestia megaterium NBRC 15308 = ATCC 14581]